MLSRRRLIISYTIQHVIPNICTKFKNPKNPRFSSSWEIFDEKKSLHTHMIPVYLIHPPIVHVCTKFQPSRPRNFWESVTKTFNAWKLERKKNDKMKGQICSSSLILVYTIDPPIVHVHTKFQPSRTHSSWEMYTWYINLQSKCGLSLNFVCLSVPEKREIHFFYIWKLERKKNEEIEGRISRRNLVPFHIKRQMIHNTCTKLQNPTCN